MNRIFEYWVLGNISYEDSGISVKIALYAAIWVLFLGLGTVFKFDPFIGISVVIISFIINTLIFRYVRDYV